MCGIGIVVEGLEQKVSSHPREDNDDANPFDFKNFFSFDTINDENNLITLDDFLPSYPASIQSRVSSLSQKHEIRNNPMNRKNAPAAPASTYTTPSIDDNSSCNDIQKDNNANEFMDELIESLRRRGPDHTGYWKTDITNSEPNVNSTTSWQPTTVHLVGSVLHMSGAEITKQPVPLIDGSYFVYNGEIFGYRNPTDPTQVTRLGQTMDTSTSSATIHTHDNLNDLFTYNTTNKQNVSDTLWLQTEINHIISHLQNNQHNIQLNSTERKAQSKSIKEDLSSSFDICLRQFLECIEGPFAFIHFCPQRKRIFAMRDTFGRRSLCVNLVNDNAPNDINTDIDIDIDTDTAKINKPMETNTNRNVALCIANVAMGPNSLELPCSGAFVFELGNRIENENPNDNDTHSNNRFEIHHHPRSRLHKSPFEMELLTKFWKCSIHQDYLDAFQTNVTKQQNDKNDKKVQHHTKMDFMEDTTTQSSSNSLLKDLTSDNNDLSIFKNNRNVFRTALTNAIHRHIMGNECIAVLFSGGVDSSVIAALAAQELQKQYNHQRNAQKQKQKQKQTLHEIDHAIHTNISKPTLELINVSFDPEKGPDRHTAFCSLQDLFTTCFRKTAPDVRYEIFLIDKCLEDIDHSLIVRLLGPHSSVMDFNIATALWCGSQGRGYRLRWWPELENTLSDYLLNHNEISTTATYFTMKEEVLDSISNMVQREMLILQQLISQANVPFFNKPGSEKGRNNLHHLIRKTFQNKGNHGNDADSGLKTTSQNLPNEQNCIAKIDCNLYTKYYFHQDSTNANLTKQHDLPVARGRVLLAGHGADELMGGYARTISAFEKRGKEGLMKEMGVDLKRLWQRNLGRDDRVLSDFGRESRQPFLDEEFVDCVRTLPPLVDKIYLRDLASANDIGMSSSAARFDKRAIQFGTRIAQRSNKALCGTNRKGKGTDPFVVKK